MTVTPVDISFWSIQQEVSTDTEITNKQRILNRVNTGKQHCDVTRTVCLPLAQSLYKLIAESYLCGVGVVGVCVCVCVCMNVIGSPPWIPHQTSPHLHGRKELTSSWHSSIFEQNPLRIDRFMSQKTQKLVGFCAPFSLLLWAAHAVQCEQITVAMGRARVQYSGLILGKNDDVMHTY